MHDAAAQLVLIIALGIGSQWLGWRLGLPAILPLLMVGFLAGPVAGVLDPDALLGGLLFLVVSSSACCCCRFCLSCFQDASS